MKTETEDYSVTKYPNDIYVIHNLIDETFCKNMIDAIDISHLHRRDYSPTNNVQTYSTVLYDMVSHNNDIVLKQNASLLLTGYVRAIPYIINNINQHTFNSGIPKISDVEMRKVYGETKTHIDGITEDNLRLLTCICALNDDYEEGFITFPNQDLKFRLNKGDILLFPPYWTHPHSVSKPINNYRYTITFWYLHPSTVAGMHIS
jgi:hypothetical protein